MSGDWTAVTALQQKQTNGSWLAVDTLADSTGNYIYAIVAAGTSGKSAPAYQSVSTGTITGRTLGATVKDDKIQLKWTADETETYRLERAEVKRNNVDLYEATLSNYELVSASYTAITVPATAYVQGEAVINDAPAANKNYIYKLTTIKSGVESNPSFYIANTEAFSTYAAFTVARSTDTHYSQNAAANSLAVSVNYSSSYYNGTTTVSTYEGRDYTIDIFRRASTSSQETPFAKVGQVTLTKESSAPVVFVDTTVTDITLTYTYKAVAVGFGVPASSNLSGGLVTYGRNVSQYMSGTYSAAAQTLGTASIPARAVRLATGTLVTDNPATTNVDEYYNNGPNSAGLVLTVEYTDNAATPVTKTVDLTITRVSDTTNNTAALGRTTTYYYYIQLPADIGSGAVRLVGLPWDENIASPTTIVTIP